MLGYLDQEAKAKNLRSTKTLLQSEPVNDDLSPPLEAKCHQLCTMILDKQELIKSYSDQTGRFPIPSSRGNHYLFILYHYDTNSIHAEAIPNRQAASIRTAWETVHKTLIRQGHPPNLHILDNECSQELKEAFTKYNIDFQRVPPKEHRANAAERAIHTFKNHFISTLCTVDSKYPMSEWDRLLPQTILTLNLLRSSRTHPFLSAHASLFGQYDFNRIPLAPPGTKIIAHVSADARTTFGEHGKVGWYIEPSPRHYRCYKCYFTDTMKERDVLKVDFFPEKIPFPKFTPEDYLKQTAEDMLHLLQTPKSPSTESPLAFGPPILNAFAKIASILGRATAPPPTPTPVPIIQPPPQVILPSPTHTLVTPTSVPVPPPRVPLASPRVPIPLSKHNLPTHFPTTNYQVPPTFMKYKTPHFQMPNFHPRHTTYNPRQPFLNQPNNYFNPRASRLQFAQSVQHDSSVSGKMFNPTTGRAETIDTLLHGPDKDIWTTSLTNEWARCAQGISRSRSSTEAIVGNQTIFFIPPHQVPTGCKVTYANFVCTMHPGKAEAYQIRMMVGGDKLDAFQDVCSPTVGITDTKLHINSTISDAKHGARHATAQAI
jgi:hypothetical protein